MYRGGYTRGSTSGNTRENRSSLKDVLKREQVDDIYTSNVCEVILTLENSDLKWFSDANYIASRYFEPYNHYPLKGSNNTRLFYETILKETQSVEFEHFYRGGNTQQNRHAPYSFSKASFKKMLSPTDWGLDPNRTRQMTNYPNMPYTYWDYKDAWYNCFYYNNPDFKHTWFFRFMSDFIINDPPNWSIHWWEKFGPKINVLPEELYLLFPGYKEECCKCSNEGNDIPMMKLMMVYNLPWIWTWEYATKQIQGFNKGLPTLVRQFKYKWWNKFNTEETVKQLKADIQYCKNKNQEKLKLQEKEEIKDPLKSLKETLRRKYPQASKKEIQKKLLEIASFSDNEDEDDGNTNMSITEESPEDFEENLQYAQTQ